ncbi:MAG: thymidine phosphorylase [Defluviitaleaceae bacterium]|nr:thymidine phosphorylase [Defluviitaleaceae bacterium]
MRIFDILDKKKNGVTLSEAEIRFAVNGFSSGEVSEGQMAALLMAVCINGLNREETAYLTMAMADSGDVLDVSGITRPVADKHSTGGVGDKLTLTVGPMVAACGVAMAKMSGRALGHTGGTIDKLETIPGFVCDLTNTDFMRILEDVGIVIASQTANLAPADKIIYALRDKTATVDSIPLIAASVMSKKIAAGANTIVLDVKVGNGAFMKTHEEARQLAQVMVDIGRDCGRNMSAVITAMDAPLGYAVGNASEVAEAVDVLRGEGPEDIRILSIELTAQILVQALKIDEETARKKAQDCIDDGSAFDRLLRMVIAQDGDLSAISDWYADKPMMEVKSPKTGYISAMDGQICGHASRMVDDILFIKKTGDYVEKGEAIAQIYGENLQPSIDLITTAYTFADAKPTQTSLIYEIIR